MIDAPFIQRKLELIAEELGRLVAFKSWSYEEIADDFIKLAALERILERIVNRAVDVNQHIISRSSTGNDKKITRLTYRETFLKLADLDVYPAEFAERIARSAGLRNVLVHEYNDVDRRIVYGSIRTCIEEYRAYIDHVRTFVASREENAP